MRVDDPRVTHPYATLLGPIAETVLVRLACVRRAASVDSEPGSNSRLKPVASPTDGGSDIVSQSLDFPLEDESILTRSTRLSKNLSSAEPY